MIGTIVSAITGIVFFYLFASVLYQKRKISKLNRGVSRCPGAGYRNPNYIQCLNQQQHTMKNLEVLSNEKTASLISAICLLYDIPTSIAHILNACPQYRLQNIKYMCQRIEQELPDIRLSRKNPHFDKKDIERRRYEKPQVLTREEKVFVFGKALQALKKSFQKQAKHAEKMAETDVVCRFDIVPNNVSDLKPVELQKSMGTGFKSLYPPMPPETNPSHTKDAL